MPLRHRHDYAAGIHRGLPAGDMTRLSTAIDFSPWADVGFPRVWPGGFPGGGHGFPRGCSGEGQSKGLTPLPVVA